MAESIELVDPARISQNPENPRLIFRPDELAALEQSIADQGILVPLTLYRDKREYYLLDGERRWRCSIKLGLERVPAIIQPKPERLQNIMMMFAIHNAREDWDPLPTAFKLRDLEGEFTRQQGREPNEAELAGLASISRGEVRRLRSLLRLPAKYHRELLEELEKPQSKQVLTVDHVLETTRGASALEKRGVIDGREEDRLRQAIIRKFKNRTIQSTVDPRQLARIARAVERDEVPLSTARRAVMRIVEDREYTIRDAFRDSVEQVDFAHGTAQIVDRLTTRLEIYDDGDYELTDSLRASLTALRAALGRILQR